MNSISGQKEQLRTAIRARATAISPEQRAAFSVAAQTQLLQRPEWREAKCILGYLPLKDELDLTNVLQAALETGKTVALPRYLPEAGEYCAAELSTEISGLARGAFGVREPSAAACILPLNRLDFALVPGVAFDPGGRRLGRGKGFYDRLLAKASGVLCVKCGVCLEEQIVDSIPAEPHDVVMNYILTPTRWRIVAEAPPASS